MSTLSVETSTSGSSTATVSPTFFNQRVTVPSVTDSPSAGRVTSLIVIPNYSYGLSVRVERLACEGKVCLSNCFVHCWVSMN